VPVRAQTAVLRGPPVFYPFLHGRFNKLRFPARLFGVWGGGGGHNVIAGGRTKSAAAEIPPLIVSFLHMLGGPLIFSGGAFCELGALDLDGLSSVAPSDLFSFLLSPGGPDPLYQFPLIFTLKCGPSQGGGSCGQGGRRGAEVGRRGCLNK